MPGTCIWFWMGKLFIVDWSQCDCLVFLWDCLHFRGEEKNTKKLCFVKEGKCIKKKSVQVHISTVSFCKVKEGELSLQVAWKRRKIGDWKCKMNFWTLWEEPSPKPQKVGFWLKFPKEKVSFLFAWGYILMSFFGLK